MSLKSELTFSSLQFQPLGSTFLILKSTNETFEIKKPYTSVHNLMMGETYLWTNGKGSCKNLNTGHFAEIIFKPIGYWSKSSEIEGKVFDE